MSRPPKIENFKTEVLPQSKPKLLVAAPLNFLLGASETELSSFELARLAEVANLRADLHAILDKLIDEMSQSAIAGWFRTQDRQTIKSAIEHPEEAILRIAALAKEQIRDSQRSAAELIPRPPLEPGAARLAATLRYQARNIAAGKCQNCPQPIDPRSHRLCTKHLLMERGKYTPKRKRVEPGTISWLYGESLEPGDGRSIPQERQKMRRIGPEGRQLIERVAKQLGLTPEHVRSVALGDRPSERIVDAIDKEFTLALDKAKQAKKARGES